MKENINIKKYAKKSDATLQCTTKQNNCKGMVTLICTADLNGRI
jgi:hypothetical protein